MEQRYNDKAIDRKTSKDPTPKRSNVEDCKIEELGNLRENDGQLLLLSIYDRFVVEQSYSI